MKNDLYQERYGRTASRPGAAPDYTRCCIEVRLQGRWPDYGQCQRNRGHGPDGAYCKQHDPAAVKAREAKQEAKYNADFNERRYGYHGRSFFMILEEIANGHNDPRALAQQTIDEFKQGEK